VLGLLLSLWLQVRDYKQKLGLNEISKKGNEKDNAETKRILLETTFIQ
jgi:hypothetical protein